MIRPSRSDIARVDRLVGELDRELITDSYREPATLSYAVIVLAWRKFKAFIDALDIAIGSPFDDGGIDTLAGADALLGHEAQRLAFWLTYVAAAIGRASQPI